MLERLNMSDEDLESLKMRSRQFGNEGLRTMVCAMKILNDEEVIILKEFLNKNKKQRSETNPLEFYENFENGLNFLGLVALED